MKYLKKFIDKVFFRFGFVHIHRFESPKEYKRYVKDGAIYWVIYDDLCISMSFNKETCEKTISVVFLKEY